MAELLNLLPEMQDEIFKYCLVSDLINLACCSSGWSNALKGRLWRNVKISSTSLVKQFAIFGNRNKFKNLQHTRSLHFSADESIHGIRCNRTKKKKCLKNYSKVLKYCNPHAVDTFLIEDIFVNNASVRLCCEVFQGLKKLSIQRRWNMKISSDVFLLITSLHNLLELDLYKTSTDDENLLMICFSLTNLRLLNVGDTNVSDNGLENIVRLKSLNNFVVSGCNITDQGLPYVGMLTRLEKLDVTCQYFNITDRGVAHLKNLLCLEELHLCNCKVTDAGLPCITEILSIRSLDIGHSYITDDGLKHLHELKNLTVLDIRGCTGITDQGISHIASLTSVRKLNISRIMVTDAAVLHLCELPNLKELKMFGCFHITDNGMPIVDSIKSLESLDIRFTYVTSVGIKCLTRLKSLKH